jgi:hypothetical protein
MTNPTPISFGDNVRVRRTPETEGVGLAGLTGEVRGETTPSLMGIEVIGEDKDDFAFNVFIEDRDEAYWFAPDLLEFIDHAVGTEMWVEGDSKKWVRTADGNWEESQVAQRGLVQRLLGIFKRSH